MTLQEIWRYPVKSMAGESLESAELTEMGIAGDRALLVRSNLHTILTARTRPLLLRHRAAIASGGAILVDGRRWDAADVVRDVEVAAGPGARLVEAAGPDRFDVLPLLVATDGMLAAAGYDRRRFRPNLVIGGVPGFAEREWPGARLRIGSAVIALEDLRTRCIMTTFDPDSGQQNLEVLARIRREFGGRLGLNAYVVSPGRIQAGDCVQIVRP